MSFLQQEIHLPKLNTDMFVVLEIKQRKWHLRQDKESKWSLKIFWIGETEREKIV